MEFTATEAARGQTASFRGGEVSVPTMCEIPCSLSLDMKPNTMSLEILVQCSAKLILCQLDMPLGTVQIAYS